MVSVSLCPPHIENFIPLNPPITVIVAEPAVILAQTLILSISSVILIVPAIATAEGMLSIGISAPVPIVPNIVRVTVPVGLAISYWIVLLDDPDIGILPSFAACPPAPLYT